MSLLWYGSYYFASLGSEWTGLIIYYNYEQGEELRIEDDTPFMVTPAEGTQTRNVFTTFNEEKHVIFEMVLYKHALRIPIRFFKLNYPMWGRIYHAFVVFTSLDANGQIWFWSIEKNMEAIVMQRSTILEDVRDNFRGTARTARVYPHRSAKVDTTMIRLYFYLRIMHQQYKRYQLGRQDCQKFAELIFSEYPGTSFARRTLKITLDNNFIMRH